jgi:hypothetical protein
MKSATVYSRPFRVCDVVMGVHSIQRSFIKQKQTRFSCLLAIAALHLAMLEGFLTNHSPHKNTVEAYLEALRNDNIEKQNFYCLDTLLEPTALEKVQAWEFVEQAPRLQEHDPNSHAVDVVMRIKSRDEDNVPITETWQFIVWNSNTLSEYKSKLNEQLNQTGEASRQLAIAQIPDRTHCIIHLQPVRYSTLQQS